MNPAQLKYVIAIAQEGSMNKAARKLFVAQPNISRALHDLEKELQITIFTRTPQGMHLTPIGEQFIHKAQSIVHETDQLYQLGHNNRKSLFSISLTRSSYLMDAISEWINHMGQEGLPVHLHFKETNNYNIIEDVSLGRSDLGIIRFDSSSQRMYDELLASKNLSSQELVSAKMRITMRADHPLSRYSDIPYSELKKYPEIVHGDDALPVSSLYSDVSAAAAAHPAENAQARRIYVYDRGSLIMLLHKLKNAYMWTSPLPKEQLELYHMVIRPWSFATNVMRDVLVYDPRKADDPLVSSCIQALKQYAQGLEI